jgi:hypothetical protein
MLLVTPVFVQLLVHSAELVRRCCWSFLTVVLVLLVPCPTSWVLICFLMGDFLHRIRGCWVV